MRRNTDRTSRRRRRTSWRRTSWRTSRAARCRRASKRSTTMPSMRSPRRCERQPNLRRTDMTKQREEHGTQHDSGAPADGALSDEALDGVTGGAADLGWIMQLVTNAMKEQDKTNEIVRNLRG